MTKHASRYTVADVIRSAEDISRRTVAQLAAEVERHGLQAVWDELGRRLRAYGSIDATDPMARVGVERTASP